MNINRINQTIQAIVLFLLANLAAVVLICGLGVIVYTFFTIATAYGLFSLGAVLVVISLLLAQERG